MRWIVLLLIARTAYAEPTDLVARPLVLDEGQVAAQLVLETNDAPDHGFGNPVSIAPDVWVGITPRVTLGIIHSDPSVDRFAPGASICIHDDPTLTKDDALCHKETYRGGGLDALYNLDMPAGFSFAPHARFLIRDLEPVKPALTLGASARWQHGRWAVSADPFVQLGLYNLGRGNRAQLWIPIALAVQPMERWVIEFHTGWDSEIETIRDGWHVPIAAGVRAMATQHLEVGGEFGFTSLLGPQNNPKQRVVFLSVGWRT